MKIELNDREADELLAHLEKLNSPNKYTNDVRRTIVQKIYDAKREAATA